MTVSGDKATVYVRDEYTLTCNTNTGTAASTYQWMKSNVTIANVTGRTLSFSSLKLSDAGLYVCKVTINSTDYCGVKDITLESKYKSNSVMVLRLSFEV